MGKSSGSQKVTQTTKLPAWIDTAAQDLLKQGNAASANLATPYMGNTVAGINPMQQAAIDAAGGSIGMSQPGFDTALGAVGEAANYTPGMMAGADYSPYLNPYLANVEGYALQNADRAYRQNLNSIADQAIGANAFGGSRQGVAEGVAAAENARQVGDLSAQLRSQGFTNAQTAMQSDYDRGLQGAQLNAQAGQMYGQLAAADQESYLQSLQSALSAGNITQQQAQALLTQAQQQYDAQKQYPLEQLDINASTLASTPYGGSVTKITPTQGSPLMGALGGLGLGNTLFSTGGALAGLGISPMLGSLGTGLLGGLSMLSDERMKTNIQPLGHDPGTGLPMYAYDYIADVERANATGQPMPAKRVGPMAQDIEQMYPGNTGSIGGHKVVTDQSRVGPEGFEYLTTTNDSGGWTPASILGWMMGAQDWADQYPTPAGGKSNLPPGIL